MRTSTAGRWHLSAACRRPGPIVATYQNFRPTVAQGSLVTQDYCQTKNPLTVYINGIDHLGMDVAKLFKNGRSQAVRLPKEYRFRGKQVFVRKVGKGVLLMPEEGSWEAMEESVALFSDDFLAERTQGQSEEREGLFE